MSLVNYGPTKHLSWNELKCKDGTVYPPEFIEDGRIFQLAAVFERIREMMGNKPLRILSAYRTKSYNKKIGGATNSYHMEGKALDLATPVGMAPYLFYTKVRDNAQHLGVTGLGLYSWGIHIDIRSTKKLVLWSGNAVKDSWTDTKGLRVH